MALFIFLITAAISFSSAAAMNGSQIAVATQEMQRANYFTFVMLLNMAPPNAFQGQNLTFLMPNDRALARAATAVGGATVLDFLLRHSIPSPLLIDHLEHFPTGSTVPASKPGFAFEVTNNGRRQFFLSNVRITSPNICTQGNSIRCHGIDGVAEPAMLPQPNLPQTPTCPAAPVPPDDDGAPVLVVAPPPADEDSPTFVVAAPPPPVAGGESSTGVDLVVVMAVMIVGLLCYAEDLNDFN